MSSRGVLTDAVAGTFEIGGELTARRLGFGAMRIASARDSGGSRDRDLARNLVRGVVDRGVTLIDTANVYAYGASEEIICEALHPYPADLVIATKAGFRPGKILPGQVTLPPEGKPSHIRRECDASLARLRIERIDLYQIHAPDPRIPYAETIGAFVELQRAGKIRHIGLSNVTLEQLQYARGLCDVATVQNRYNAGDRSSDAVVDACADAGIGFMPWAPVMLPGRRVARVVAEIAGERGATVQQVALQWLLHRSPVMLPIPGTSQSAHAAENIDAAWLELDAEAIARIDDAYDR